MSFKVKKPDNKSESLGLLVLQCETDPGRQSCNGIPRVSIARRAPLSSNEATKAYMPDSEARLHSNQGMLKKNSVRNLSEGLLPTVWNERLSVSSTEDQYYSSCESIDDLRLTGNTKVESFSFNSTESEDIVDTKASKLSHPPEERCMVEMPMPQCHLIYPQVEGKVLTTFSSTDMNYFFSKEEIDNENDIIYEADSIENGDFVIPGQEGSMKEASTILVNRNPRAKSNTLLIDDSSCGASIEYEADNQISLNEIQDPPQGFVENEERTTPPLGILSKSSNDSGMSMEKLDNMQREARNFAIEHRVFVKCLLTLLAQRDMIVVDMDDPDTLKCGSLKKATHIVKGAWKYKYVEIRRGMFSYYDDSLSKHAASEGDLVRKNIKLNANTTKCRAVKLNHKSLTHVSIQGKVFELAVEGTPRRFWMANSRQERSAWIRAINDAMVGGSNIRPDLQIEHSGRSRKVSRKSPYRSDLGLYLKIQREIKSASTKKSYVEALSCIIGRTLNVPVKWISDQNNEDMDSAFCRDSVTGSVDQLWKDLARDSVQINDVLFKGEGGHAPERIIGGLTCEIMRTDRTSPLRPEDPNFLWRGVSELQALSFARDILLSGNRTRSGGDSYYCVDLLCQNASLVVLVPSSLEAEPLSVTVEHPTQEQRPVRTPYSTHDRSGWLKTRTKKNRKWRKRYFVLSEGTLSFYKKAHPKPYNLEGHIKVNEIPIYVASLAPITIEKKDRKMTDKIRYTLTFKGKEGSLERQIRFEDGNIFLLWAYALEATITKPEPFGAPKKNGMFRILNLRDEPKSDSQVGFILEENSLELHASDLGFDPGSVTSKGKALSIQHGGTKSPTVSVSVRASTVYKVCTLDPQGVESEDTWATISATFLQTFTIVGGPNGLMNRSEEIVQVNVKNCSGVEERILLNTDSTITPRSMARIKRKLRRQGNYDTIALSDKADSC